MLTKYTIEVYYTEKGKIPFNEWLFELPDRTGRQKINIRLHRLSLGNFGSCKRLKNGISELKIDFGPGYRIYFSKIETYKVLILVAGTKRTQAKDIQKALTYLSDFKTKGK